MTPRDLGYALAARLVDLKGAGALVEKAPRGAAPAIQAVLTGLAPDELSKRVQSLLTSLSVLLGGIHASWLAARLIDEPQEVLDAVCRHLPEDERKDTLLELERFGRKPKSDAAGTKELRVALDGEAVARFRARAFPDLRPAGKAPAEPELAWLATAPARDIVHVARECGLRAVARAFARIAREDLAKLCHGLPPADSVRLVAHVVELNEKLGKDELRTSQATHLRLLKSAGISPELFDDTGLAFLAAAGVSRLDEVQRAALIYRVPEALGRRLLELSAKGALPEEAAIEEYRKELRAWITEWKQQGVLKG